jgi:diaminohydroxyphosphoribosylaminopyrimidine deaminase / 5-amino-6-(5-phosphoribosylamino)uracil reductase
LSVSEVEIQHLEELVEVVTNSAVRPTPNPRVGARILDANGQLVGEGIHGMSGNDHAEVIALTQAGAKAVGGTAIVTLEPCNHTGKTGPCADALIAAGVSRVVYAVDDTGIAAGGAEHLQTSGIVCEKYFLAEADALVEPWLHFQFTGLPYVTLKIATTLDGYIAAADGSSRWITGELAREQVHKLRARVDAVAVGTGTVLADDPALDVRLVGEWPQPKIFVLGNRKLPVGLRIGENYIQIENHDPVSQLQLMAEAGVQHVLLEGGAKIASAFLAAGLVDQLIWFTAPKILGSGSSAVSDLGITAITDAQSWTVFKSMQFGPDRMLDMRPMRTTD